MKDLRDLNLEGKTILMRVDFNVPISSGIVKDDTRIKGALPTINHLLSNNNKVVLMSHLGRPNGREEKYSLKPVAEHLARIYGFRVHFSPDLIGESVQKLIEEINFGEVILLENTRFYQGETKNDDELCKELAKLGNVYVNDAFGTAHRAHASTVGITKYLPSYPGLLMGKEISKLEEATKYPVKPVLTILGGAKVSDKIQVIEYILKITDKLIIGGGMAFTFLKVLGYNIGKSLLEEHMQETAKNILEKAKELGVEIILPTDIKLAKSFDEPVMDGNTAKQVKIEEITDDVMGLDIGSDTIKQIEKVIKQSNTILWNGPMGVFEKKLYSEGTMSVARAVLERNVLTIIGGGDSVYAINNTLNSLKIILPDDSPIHISTGGGATLEYLSGIDLPGVAVMKS
jgi:3-phosphoglycerate kinase